MTNKTSLLKTLIIASTIPLLVLGLKTANDIRKSAAGQPANISVDAQNISGPNPSTLWQNFSQGGEEPRDMIGPVYSLVRQLQPKLIRLDHLFDYYQVYKGDNDYDFTQLDQVVKSVLITGSIPLLSLSYTPAAMAKDNKVASIPNDWGQWDRLIAATGKRYSVDQKISGIYYEVWNEPDLFGGWKADYPPSYLDLYSHTVRALQSGIGPTNNYKVGGPAITAYYPNWIRALLKYATVNNLPFDFISWHKYSKNIDDYNRDFDQLNSILTDYPRFFNIERFITEFGPNSEPDRDYDTSASAIHLMAVVNNLVGKIHRLFTFEVVDGPNPGRNDSSGWGLITHKTNGNKPKPRFYGVTFLNQLQGSQLSVTGNGSWVSALATKNSQQIQIELVNQIQIELVNYDPANIHSETFPLKITNVAPGSYTLKRTDFLGTTSSQIINLTGTTYETLFFLNPNSAVILTLTPQ